MAHTFDFALDLQQHNDSISPSPPETATPRSQHSPQKSSQRRWSASADDYEDRIVPSTWEAPPVPPIPPDQPSEAWRRRSLKRDSYTSQMSLRPSESGTRPQTPLGSSTSDDKIPAVPPQSPRTTTKRISRMTMNVREKCQYEELHWTVSGLNPKGWSRRKKWLHTLAAGGVTFAVLFSSSIVAPASAVIETSFSTSPIVAVLSTLLYVVGLAFGSILGGASSALVGRKVAQSGSLLLSVAFTIASACVDSFAALHACRFFAGLAASPAVWISVAILLEMWSTEKLAVPIIAFSSSALAGLTLGPVAGSYIIASQNVRWTQYTILIACAMALALVLAMRETHKATVQRRRGEVRHATPSLSKLATSAIAEPLGSVCREPSALLLSIYTGAVIGTYYTAITAFPTIFASAYGFSLVEQELTMAAMLVGVLIGAVLLALNHALVYRLRVGKWKQHYDAEVERAIAEEKQLKRRSRWNSRASSNLPKRKSTASLFSAAVPTGQQAGSRTSLMQAFTKHDSRTDLVSTMIDFEDKNVALSVAAAQYLNSNNEKRILPERVLLILSKQPPFGDMCEQLEAYGLRVDRVKLAQIFLDALQHQQQQSETRPTTGAESAGRAFHHANSAAALENTQSAARPTLHKSHTTWTLLSKTSPTFKAPPAWRLWPALPASLTAVGGLFLFAWTAKGSIHWILACIGTALFAASGAIILVSTTLYMLEKSGGDAVAGGSVVSWLLAAVFPIFSVPMFRSLAIGVAGSVLAIIVLACGVPVWVVVLKGRGR